MKQFLFALALLISAQVFSQKWTADYNLCSIYGTVASPTISRNEVVIEMFQSAAGAVFSVTVGPKEFGFKLEKIDAGRRFYSVYTPMSDSAIWQAELNQNELVIKESKYGIVPKEPYKVWLYHFKK